MKVSQIDTDYLFQTAFFCMPCLTVLTDRDLTILKASESFLNAFQMQPKQVCNQNLLKMVRLGITAEQQIRQYLLSDVNNQGVCRLESFISTSSDTGFWAVVEIRFFQYQGETLCLCGLTDITDQKRAEDKVRTASEQMQTFEENTSDLIQSVRPDGTLEYVNKKWLETLGYPAEEVPDLNITDILRKTRSRITSQLCCESSSGKA